MKEDGILQISKLQEEIRNKLKSYLHHREFDVDPISVEDINKIINNKIAIYDLNQLIKDQINLEMVKN